MEENHPPKRFSFSLSTLTLTYLAVAVVFSIAFLVCKYVFMWNAADIGREIVVNEIQDGVHGQRFFVVQKAGDDLGYEWTVQYTRGTQSRTLLLKLASDNPRIQRSFTDMSYDAEKDTLSIEINLPSSNYVLKEVLVFDGTHTGQL